MTLKNKTLFFEDNEQKNKPDYQNRLTVEPAVAYVIFERQRDNSDENDAAIHKKLGLQYLDWLEKKNGRSENKI